MMTIDDISVLAYKGEKPDIKELTVPEWLLWYRLRDVYRECLDNPEAGAELKQKQVSQYETDRTTYVKLQEVYDCLSSQWKRIEPAASRFALDPTVENGIKFFEAVYMVPINVQLQQWEKGESNG